MRNNLIGRSAEKIADALKIREKFLSEVEELLLEEAMKQPNPDEWYDANVARATELCDEIQLAQSWISMRSGDAKREMFPYHDLSKMQSPIPEKSWQVSDELARIERDKWDLEMAEKYALPPDDKKRTRKNYLRSLWGEAREMKQEYPALPAEYLSLVDQLKEWSDQKDIDLWKPINERYEAIALSLLAQFGGYYRMRARVYVYELLAEYINESKSFLDFAKEELEQWPDLIVESERLWKKLEMPFFYLQCKPTGFNELVESSRESYHVVESFHYRKDRVPEEVELHPVLVRFFLEEATRVALEIYQTLKEK